MGAEFLVAILWGVVIVYWFWTRRPTTGDTVGLFRYELRALQDATPTRVAPANQMRMTSRTEYRRYSPVTEPTAGRVITLDGWRGQVTGTSLEREVPAVFEPPLLPLAEALPGNRQERARRRRWCVASLLTVAALAVLVGAMVTRSAPAIVAQVALDAVLVCYGALVLKTTRASRARPVPVRQCYEPEDRRAPAVGAAHGTGEAGHGTGVASSGSGYVPAHALSTGRRSVRAYGDFDSYADLALAQAN